MSVTYLRTKFHTLSEHCYQTES